MFKTLLLMSLVLSGILYAKSINIAVSANVSYAIKPLIKEFNKNHPHIRVRVTLGSSGKLTAQIKHGAPYGVFMSANMNYPQALYKEGIALSKPIVYAQGGLAYLSVKKRDFSKGMHLLEEPSIRKIAVANPKTAPYGIAAKEALLKGGVYEALNGKFVYGESISQTVSYAVNAADIGIVAKSSLYSPQMAHLKNGENWVEVKSELYRPINQGIVILKEREELRKFYKFMMSARAKNILKNFGYLVP